MKEKQKISDAFIFTNINNVSKSIELAVMLLLHAGSPTSTPPKAKAHSMISLEEKPKENNKKDRTSKKSAKESFESRISVLKVAKAVKREIAKDKILIAISWLLTQEFLRAHATTKDQSSDKRLANMIISHIIHYTMIQEIKSCRKEIKLFITKNRASISTFVHEVAHIVEIGFDMLKYIMTFTIKCICIITTWIRACCKVDRHICLIPPLKIKGRRISRGKHRCRISTKEDQKEEKDEEPNAKEEPEQPQKLKRVRQRMRGDRISSIFTFLMLFSVISFSHFHNQDDPVRSRDLFVGHPNGGCHVSSRATLPRHVCGFEKRFRNRDEGKPAIPPRKQGGQPRELENHFRFKGHVPPHTFRGDAKAPGAGGEGTKNQYFTVPDCPSSNRVRDRRHASWQVGTPWRKIPTSRSTPGARSMPSRRPKPKQKRHEEGVHRHPGPPQPQRRIHGKTKAAKTRITSKTSYKKPNAAAYGLPPLAITNEMANSHPPGDYKQDAPPRTQGSSIYEEWLEECVLNSGDETDEEALFETDLEDAGEATEDDDEGSDEEEGVEWRTMINGRDEPPEEGRTSQKRTRAASTVEKRSVEVHPPRQRTEEPCKDCQTVKKQKYMGKEEKEGKIQNVCKNTGNTFALLKKLPRIHKETDGFSSNFSSSSFQQNRLQADQSTNDSRHESMSEGSMHCMPGKMQSMVDKDNEGHSHADLEQDLADITDAEDADEDMQEDDEHTAGDQEDRSKDDAISIDDAKSRAKRKHSPEAAQKPKQSRHSERDSIAEWLEVDGDDFRRVRRISHKQSGEEESRTTPKESRKERKKRSRGESSQSPAVQKDGSRGSGREQSGLTSEQQQQQLRMHIQTSNVHSCGLQQQQQYQMATGHQ